MMRVCPVTRIPLKVIRVDSAKNPVNVDTWKFKTEGLTFLIVPTGAKRELKLRLSNRESWIELVVGALVLGLVMF